MDDEKDDDVNNINDFDPENNNDGVDVDVIEETKYIKTKILPKTIPVDGDGKMLDRTAILFLEEDWKDGAEHPWELRVQGKTDRSMLLKDVKFWINMDGNPLTRADPSLKPRFKAWFSGLLGVSNEIFANNQALNDAIGQLSTKYNGLANAKETVIESPSPTIAPLNKKNESGEFNKTEEQIL